MSLVARSRRLSLTALGLFGLIAQVVGCDGVVTTIGRYTAPDDRAGSGGAALGGSFGSGGAVLGGAGSGEGGAGALGNYFEAEDGVLSGALVVGESPSASAGAFITASEAAETSDAPGGGRALYRFDVETDGDYVLWGRIHSPGVSSNRFWVQVDDGEWILWRVSTGEEWFWDDVHDNFEFGVPWVFTLSKGEHQLAVAPAVLGAELDRFLVAPAGEPRPPSEIECNPPHSVKLDGECVRSCGSYGNVSCIVEDCAGREELVSYDCGICCLLN